MGVIFLMLIVSLIIALFFLVSFIWATKNGQYDDDITPSIRILFDDEKIKSNTDTDGSTEV